jgi:hypothetical protein
MNFKVVTTAALLAWTGAILSSAAPASAWAYTAQTGTYAACASSYQAVPSQIMCWGGISGNTASATYTQTMRFNSTNCSSGACSYGTNTVYTDMIYPIGRQATSYQGQCTFSGVTRNWFGLTSCAC